MKVPLTYPNLTLDSSGQKAARMRAYLGLPEDGIELSNGFPGGPAHISNAVSSDSSPKLSVPDVIFKLALYAFTRHENGDPGAGLPKDFAEISSSNLDGQQQIAVPTGRDSNCVFSDDFLDASLHGSRNGNAISNSGRAHFGYDLSRLKTVVRTAAAPSAREAKRWALLIDGNCNANFQWYAWVHVIKESFELLEFFRKPVFDFSGKKTQLSEEASLTKGTKGRRILEEDLQGKMLMLSRGYLESLKLVLRREDGTTAPANLSEAEVSAFELVKKKRIALYSERLIEIAELFQYFVEVVRDALVKAGKSRGKNAGAITFLLSLALPEVVIDHSSPCFFDLSSSAAKMRLLKDRTAKATEEVLKSLLPSSTTVLGGGMIPARMPFELDLLKPENEDNNGAHFANYSSKNRSAAEAIVDKISRDFLRSVILPGLLNNPGVVAAAPAMVDRLFFLVIFGSLQNPEQDLKVMRNRLLKEKESTSSDGRDGGAPAPENRQEPPIFPAELCVECDFVLVLDTLLVLLAAQRDFDSREHGRNFLSEAQVEALLVFVKVLSGDGDFESVDVEMLEGDVDQVQARKRRRGPEENRTKKAQLSHISTLLLTQHLRHMRVREEEMGEENASVSGQERGETGSNATSSQVAERPLKRRRLVGGFLVAADEDVLMEDAEPIFEVPEDFRTNSTKFSCLSTGKTADTVYVFDEPAEVRNFWAVANAWRATALRKHLLDHFIPRYVEEKFSSEDEERRIVEHVLKNTNFSEALQTNLTPAAPEILETMDDQQAAARTPPVFEHITWADQALLAVEAVTFISEALLPADSRSVSALQLWPSFVNGISISAGAFGTAGAEVDTGAAPSDATAVPFALKAESNLEKAKEEALILLNLLSPEVCNSSNSAFNFEVRLSKLKEVFHTGSLNGAAHPVGVTCTPKQKDRLLTGEPQTRALFLLHKLFARSTAANRTLLPGGWALNGGCSHSVYLLLGKLVPDIPKILREDAASGVALLDIFTCQAVQMRQDFREHELLALLSRGLQRNNNFLGEVFVNDDLDFPDSAVQTLKAFRGQKRAVFQALSETTVKTLFDLVVEPVLETVTDSRSLTSPGSSADAIASLKLAAENFFLKIQTLEEPPQQTGRTNDVIWRATYTGGIMLIDPDSEDFLQKTAWRSKLIFNDAGEPENVRPYWSSTEKRWKKDGHCLLSQALLLKFLQQGWARAERRTAELLISAGTHDVYSSGLAGRTYGECSSLEGINPFEGASAFAPPGGLRTTNIPPPEWSQSSVSGYFHTVLEKEGAMLGKLLGEAGVESADLPAADLERMVGLGDASGAGIRGDAAAFFGAISLGKHAFATKVRLLAGGFKPLTIGTKVSFKKTPQEDAKNAVVVGPLQTNRAYSILVDGEEDPTSALFSQLIPLNFLENQGSGGGPLAGALDDNDAQQTLAIESWRAKYQLYVFSQSHLRPIIFTHLSMCPPTHLSDASLTYLVRISPLILCFVSV